MKILFLTNWFPTTNNPGFGIFIKEHAKALKKAGVDVRVLQLLNRYGSTPFRIVKKTSVDENIPIVQVFIESWFHDVTQYMLPLLKRQVNKSLENDFAGFNPDALHAHVIFSAGFLARNTARKLDIPYFITEHWSKTTKFLQNFLFGSHAKQVCRDATAIFPVSDWLRQQLIKTLGTSVQIETIPNVVDSNLFCHQPVEREKQGLKLLVIQSFRHHAKRPRLILEAVKCISVERQKEITVTFVGSGLKEAEIEQVKQVYGTYAQVNFMPVLSKPALSRQMLKADFLMHPSEVETFGLVVAESLSSGLPVIASANGALTELLQGGGGLLVQSNTVEVWKEAVLWAFENKNSFDREALSLANRSKFSPEAVGHQMTEAYRRYGVSG